MIYHLRKNDYIFSNQNRVKLLLRNSIIGDKAIAVYANLLKLNSFNEPSIVETLYLIELITNSRGSVLSAKKMYQEVSLVLKTILRNDHTFYSLYLFKVFFFPILKRRNEVTPYSINKQGNHCTITLINVNLLPLFPDIFYKYNYSIKVTFHISNSKLAVLKKYLNF